MDARTEHEPRLHTVRVGVADPRGIALRRAPAAAAPDPLRRRAVRGREVRLGPLLTADRGRADARLRPHVRRPPARDRGLPRSDLGCVPDPDVQPVGARADHVLDDSRGCSVPALHHAGAPALRTARPVDADARVGADTGVVPTVPVDVLFSDPDARRRVLGWGAPARTRDAGLVDGDRHRRLLSRVEARDPPIQRGRQLR